MMENKVPLTKFRHYTNRELVGLFEQYKTDPMYVEELKQRLEK